MGKYLRPSAESQDAHLSSTQPPPRGRIKNRPAAFRPGPCTFRSGAAPAGRGGAPAPCGGGGVIGAAGLCAARRRRASRALEEEGEGHGGRERAPRACRAAACRWPRAARSDAARLCARGGGMRCERAPPPLTRRPPAPRPCPRSRRPSRASWTFSPLSFGGARRSVGFCCGLIRQAAASARPDRGPGCAPAGSCMPSRA